MELDKDVIYVSSRDVLIVASVGNCGKREGVFSVGSVNYYLNHVAATNYGEGSDIFIFEKEFVGGVTLNKKRNILIGIVAAFIVTAIVIFSSIKISSHISAIELFGCMFKIEVLKKDYVQINDNTYVCKHDKVSVVMDMLEDQGYTFIEQEGAGYQFYLEDERITFETEALTKSYIIIYS